MERTAIYCRIDGGKGEHTAENAAKMFINTLSEYAHSQGMHIVDVYSDIGYSVHDMSRPGIKRLVADIANNDISSILVYHRRHIYRSVPPKEFCGLQLHCFQENISVVI